MSTKGVLTDPSRIYVIREGEEGAKRRMGWGGGGYLCFADLDFGYRKSWWSVSGLCILLC